jgi:ABC-type dipeptide/oligopeptide/nickel transport system ATPase component
VQAEILTLLTTLRDRGMAILLISHDLGVVAQAADRVAVMRAGKLVEVGSTRQVLDHPRDPYTQTLLAAVPRMAARPGDAHA